MKQETFKLRKNKAVKNLVVVGVMGVLIGFSNGVVEADEMSLSTQENGVVNTTLEQSGKIENVEEANKSIDNIVQKVYDTTIEFVREDTVVYTNEDEALKDVATQVVEIEQVVSDHTNQVEKAQLAIAENEKLQAEYDKAMKIYNDEKLIYNQKKSEFEDAQKAREEALKNPQYNIVGQSFTKEELDNFLKDTDISKVSYVSTIDENVSSLNTTQLTKLTLDEYKKFTLKYPDDRVASNSDMSRVLKNLETGKEYGYYNVKKGDVFTFDNVFLDAVTGNWVGLKYTVKEIYDNEGNISDSAFVEIEDGLNLTLIGNSSEVRYHVDFVDKNGEVVKLDSVILGMGDVDSNQVMKVSSDKLSPTILVGDNITISNDDNFIIAQASSYASNLSSEITNQVWYLMKDVTGFDYAFKSGIWKMGTEKVSWAWHQIGAIPFGIVIPAVPEAPIEPVKPELNLLPVPTVDNISVKYHYVDLLKLTVPVKNEVPNVEDDVKKPENPVVKTTEKSKLEEPKKPEPPTPPALQVPEKPVLPKTGDAGSVLALVGSVLSCLGIVGLKRKK